MKEGPHIEKDEQLRRLLRLKRYEQPPEGFAEEFLERFQRRQRSEIVRRSALSILWERIQAWLDGLRRPAIIWSAAGAYASLMLTLWLLPRHSPHNGSTIVIGNPAVNAPTVDYRQGSQNSTHTVTTPQPDEMPGKRRTSNQEQDKEPVIGPEEKERKEQPKLRDL